MELATNENGGVNGFSGRQQSDLSKRSEQIFLPDILNSAFLCFSLRKFHEIRHSFSHS